MEDSAVAATEEAKVANDTDNEGTLFDQRQKVSEISCSFYGYNTNTHSHTHARTHTTNLELIAIMRHI